VGILPVNVLEKECGDGDPSNGSPENSRKTTGRREKEEGGDSSP